MFRNIFLSATKLQVTRKWNTELFKDLNDFQQCLDTPVEDKSYYGGGFQDNTESCHNRFKNIIPLELRCFTIFQKCLNTPIFEGGVDGRGNIDNTDLCKKRFEQCKKR